MIEEHNTEDIESNAVGNIPAPFTCKYCGADSWIDPSDQEPPPDYCHGIDHGTEEDRALHDR